jgi:hypothetical protein
MKYTKEISLKLQKSTGYYYFIDKCHPLAVGNSGKVYYHRHVASLSEGHWLNRSESVHHIDGNRKNNDPDNLVVTTNSAHGSIHKGKRKNRTCRTCNASFAVFSKRAKYCSVKCSDIGRRKVERPSFKALKKDIRELGYAGTGRKYNVSDNAIRKWLRQSS